MHAIAQSMQAQALGPDLAAQRRMDQRHAGQNNHARQIADGQNFHQGQFIRQLPDRNSHDGKRHQGAAHPKDDRKNGGREALRRHPGLKRAGRHQSTKTQTSPQRF